jgi:hypothetical protein
VRDNIKLPIDRIRFLNDKQIQEELQLSPQVVENLAEALEMLRRFELEDKWNYYSPLELVSKQAHRNVEAFIEELLDIDREGWLSERQLVRLDQLRLQFRCFGVPDSHSYTGKSFIEKVAQHLNLTNQQLKIIRSIVEDELGDALLIKNQLEPIQAELTEQQSQALERFFRPYLNLHAPVGLSMAQCQPFLRLDDIEKHRPSTIDLELVHGTVLTLSGKVAVESAYLEGRYFFVPTPAAKIVDLVVDGELDWLDLSDQQKTEIGSLKYMNKRPDGRRVISYFGGEAPSAVHKELQPDWGLSEYAKWQERYAKARIEADEKLYEELKTILLPMQLDQIKLALATHKTLELGIYHIIGDNLAELLKLSEAQKKKIIELKDKQLQTLKKAFEAIDTRSRKELTEDQKKFIDSYLGVCCPIYPCFWVFL